MVFPLGPHRIQRFSDSAQVTWPALCKLISLGNAGLEIPIYGAPSLKSLHQAGSIWNVTPVPWEYILKYLIYEIIQSTHMKITLNNRYSWYFRFSLELLKYTCRCRNFASFHLCKKLISQPITNHIVSKLRLNRPDLVQIWPIAHLPRSRFAHKQVP